MTNGEVNEIGSSSALPGAAGLRLPRARWLICAMLFCATSINYVDRQVLGILAPTLQTSIGWSEAQYGYIVAAFQFAYAIGPLLAGRMVDRLGSRIGYAVIMGFWSLASMGHALAASALGFGAARFLLGIGEAGSFPAAIKTTAEWFPPRERSLATGIFNSGASLGAILAPALIPWITLRFGWRAAFLATGFIGAGWMVWWLAEYRRPSEHPRVSAAQLEAFPQGDRTTEATIPWITLLGYRQTWAFAVAKFLTDPIWWFYLYWLPKFFDARYHLGLSHIGLPLIVVYNVSAVGSIGGGWLPAIFCRMGMTMAKARLTVMLICALVVLPIFLASRASSLWMAIGLLSLAAAAHQGWSANLYTTVADMFPKGAVGAVVGIGSAAGSLGGVLFSFGTGWILELTHSYTPLFAMAASAYLIGLLFLQLFAPGLKPVAILTGAEAR